VGNKGLHKDDMQYEKLLGYQFPGQAPCGFFYSILSETASKLFYLLNL